MRKRRLAAAAVATFSITALLQAPASAASAPAGTLLHQVISNEQAGWAEPAGSTGITEASITGLPNGSSQLVAVTGAGPLEHNIRYANGKWQGWRAMSQPGVTVENASIAGMPNGSSQVVEVTSGGVLKHNVRNANGSWQAIGWSSPAGSTGIAQASITSLPNGSSEILAVTTTGVLEFNVRYANGKWQGWQINPQQGVTVANASIVGMPNGSSQLVEVTSTGVLRYNVVSASGGWGTWTTPPMPAYGSTPTVIAQASIAALPNGSSVIAVSAGATATLPGFLIRGADGRWAQYWGELYEHASYHNALNVSAAGMPNGTWQAIEVIQPAS